MLSDLNERNWLICEVASYEVKIFIGISKVYMNYTMKLTEEYNEFI